MMTMDGLHINNNSLRHHASTQIIKIAAMTVDTKIPTIVSVTQMMQCGQLLHTLMWRLKSTTSTLSTWKVVAAELRNDAYFLSHF